MFSKLWQAGFLYASVVEDYFTGFASLHCKGWNSVYCKPPRPQFLGSGITNLNDLLVQGTRWSSGLLDVALSKFCPLIYGPPKIVFPWTYVLCISSSFPYLRFLLTVVLCNYTSALPTQWHSLVPWGNHLFSFIQWTLIDTFITLNTFHY